MVEASFSDFDSYLSYDPLSGILTQKSDGKCPCRLTPHGYLSVYYRRVTYPAHRVAWLLYTGMWPIDQIDHINGVRNDNRIQNLRDVSSRKNNQNREVNRKGRKVGYTVSSVSGRITSAVKLNGRIYSLGKFSSIDDAVSAYEQALIDADNGKMPVVRETQGVYFSKSTNKWSSKIWVNGDEVCLGTFADRASARQKYLFVREKLLQGEDINSYKVLTEIRGCTLHTPSRKWHTVFVRNGKRISVGYFNTYEEAHSAYLNIQQKFEEDPSYVFVPPKRKNIRKVLRMDENGVILKEYPCLIRVQDDGFDFSSVSKACRGKLRQVGGYYWKYEEGAG